MENQENDVVETMREALDGMVVSVSVRHTNTELLKLGAVSTLGAVIGTAGFYTLANWWERRKYKKAIEKAAKELDGED